MTKFEKKQEFDRFMRNLSLIQNEQSFLSNQKDTKTSKKNQKKSVKIEEKKKKIDKKTMSQKKNKNKNFEKNFEKIFEQVSRYTKKTLKKFKNQVMKIKKKFVAKILDSKKIKKKQKKSVAEQKKDYENIIKNVFMKKRLNDKDLLILKNDTILIAKKKWIQTLYAWNFKKVLLKQYFNLIFKKDENEFVWSNRKLKNFDQQNSAYFRNKIKKSNLFKAKEKMRKRRVKQLKSKKNSLTGKFQKTAETSENVQISDEARTVLIYNILSIKTNTFRIKMKQARKTMKKKAAKMIQKQIANEIVNREQSQLWLNSTRIFRTRIEDLKRENRSYREENSIFKTYLDELGVDTAELIRIAKIKKADKTKKRKKKIIRVEDHEFLLSNIADFGTALEN